MNSNNIQLEKHQNQAKEIWKQQAHLLLLIHSDECQKKAVGGEWICNFRQCAKIRNILDHINICQETGECMVPHCTKSKRIINHFLQCRSCDCSICSPVRNGKVRLMNLGIGSQLKDLENMLQAVSL